MLDLDFSRALRRTSFTNRIVEGGDGALVFRLADGTGHVRLTRREWIDVGSSFEHETRPVARRAKWALALYLPCWLVVVALTNAPPVALLLGLSDWLATIFLLGTLFLTPFAIYLWQSHHVGLIAEALEATLGTRQRVPDPPTDPTHIPRWLDISSLLLVGPGLVFALVGQLRPGIFRNTPLTDAHLGPLAIAGFAVIALRLLWPCLAHWWVAR